LAETEKITFLEAESMWIRTSSGLAVFNPNSGVMISARWTKINVQEKRAEISVYAISVHSDDNSSLGLGKLEFKFDVENVKELEQEAEKLCRRIIYEIWIEVSHNRSFDITDIFEKVCEVRE